MISTAKKKSTMRSTVIKAPSAALSKANSNRDAHAEYPTNITKNNSHNLPINEYILIIFVKIEALYKTSIVYIEALYKTFMD